jgi:hypothetical protein
MSDSPAQPQSAAPTISNLDNLKTLRESVTANFHIQMGLEANAEAVLTRVGGGILMDNPERGVWEDWLLLSREHRRNLRRLADEIDTAIWRTEKANAASDSTLQEWYANAAHTARVVGGHTKAERNERLAAAWLGALTARGLRPDGRQGYQNGDGAS